MGLGAGLGGQLGIAEETTPGTPVTVTRFFEFAKESGQLEIAAIQDQGIHGGGLFNRSSRYTRTTRTVTSKIELNVPNKGLGLLLKHILGSTPSITQIGSTAAWKQIHNPGLLDGKSLTIQKGVPQAATGTTIPYTYSGCKINSTSFKCSNEFLSVELDIDGMNQTDVIPLAAASYPSTGVFNFVQSVLKFGGTVAINSGVTSISGGVAVSGLKEFELKLDTPIDTDRYFLGSNGIKAEQLENNFRTITGSFSGEFNKTTLYDLFVSGAPTPVQITFTGELIESGNFFTFDVILPAVRFNAADNAIDGPEIVPMKLEFVALDDQATTPIQITYTSTDTAV